MSLSVCDPQHPHRSIQDKAVSYQDLYSIRKKEDVALQKRRCGGDIEWEQQRKTLAEEVLQIAVDNQYTREVTHNAIALLDSIHQLQPQPPEWQDMSKRQLYMLAAVRIAVKMTNPVSSERSHLFGDAPPSEQTMLQLKERYQTSYEEITHCEYPLIQWLEGRLQMYTALFWFQQCFYHALLHLGDTPSNIQQPEDQQEYALRLDWKRELVQKVKLHQSMEYLDWLTVSMNAYSYRQIASLVFYRFLSKTLQHIQWGPEDMVKKWTNLLYTSLTSITGCSLTWIQQQWITLTPLFNQQRWNTICKMDSELEWQQRNEQDDFQHDFHRQCAYHLVTNSQRAS